MIAIAAMGDVADCAMIIDAPKFTFASPVTNSVLRCLQIRHRCSFAGCPEHVP